LESSRDKLQEYIIKNKGFHLKKNNNDLVLILTRSQVHISCVSLQVMQLLFEKFFNKIIDSRDNSPYHLK